jgi:hypothetical protein
MLDAAAAACGHAVSHLAYNLKQNSALDGSRQLDACLMMVFLTPPLIVQLSLQLNTFLYHAVRLQTTP